MLPASMQRITPGFEQHPGFGVPLAESYNTRVPCYFEMRGQAPLEEILRKPYAYFFELGKRHVLDISLTQAFHYNPNFLLSLSTTSAYRAAPSRALSVVLSSRFGLQPYLIENIEIALQESIVNAVVHGNLEVGGKFTSLVDFDSYLGLIEARLHKEPFMHRRIQIAAWDFGTSMQLAVTDEGQGFSLKDGTHGDDKKPHGRGLKLIREHAEQVWVGDDRRSLYMLFSNTRG